MLAHVSSRELSEWAAYERHEGPIGPYYERMALRYIACAQGDEKTKPFPTPPEMMIRAPVVDENENNFAALDVMLMEG